MKKKLSKYLNVDIDIEDEDSFCFIFEDDDRVLVMTRQEVLHMLVFVLQEFANEKR